MHENVSMALHYHGKIEVGYVTQKNTKQASRKHSATKGLRLYLCCCLSVIVIVVSVFVLVCLHLHVYHIKIRHKYLIPTPYLFILKAKVTER